MILVANSDTFECLICLRGNGITVPAPVQWTCVCAFVHIIHARPPKLAGVEYLFALISVEFNFSPLKNL